MKRRKDSELHANSSYVYVICVVYVIEMTLPSTIFILPTEPKRNKNEIRGMYESVKKYGNDFHKDSCCVER